MKLTKKPRRVLVVVNPASGRRNLKNTLETLESALERKGFEYDIKVTTKEGEAVNLVRSVSERVYGTVCVAGGDGTINEVVNGLYGKKKIRLGIIPLGTVNVLALQLGVPFSIPKAVDLLKTGHNRKIDLVTADNRLFLLMAGIGFDAYTIYKTDLNIKKFLGRLAYVFGHTRHSWQTAQKTGFDNRQKDPRKRLFHACEQCVNLWRPDPALPGRPD